MVSTCRIALASFAVFVVSTASMAQDTQPAIVKSLRACQSITDNGARLACFDVSAKQLDAAIDQNRLTILDKDGIRRKKRSLFGFALPDVSLFGRADTNDTPAPVEINATIKQVGSIGNGKYDLVLEDGAHWQTSDPLSIAPQSGSKIRIKRAALGSYFLFLENERAIRGRRVG